MGYKNYKSFGIRGYHRQVSSCLCGKLSQSVRDRYIYIYPDGEIDTFLNPGGTSFLDDDHYCFDSIGSIYGQEDYESYLYETDQEESEESKASFLEEIKDSEVLLYSLESKIDLAVEDLKNTIAEYEGRYDL